jgi:hypothetical protein
VNKGLTVKIFAVKNGMELEQDNNLKERFDHIYFDLFGIDENIFFNLQDHILVCYLKFWSLIFI